jgi:hypothetical protein
MVTFGPQRPSVLKNDTPAPMGISLFETHALLFQLFPVMLSRIYLSSIM